MKKTLILPLISLAILCVVVPGLLASAGKAPAGPAQQSPPAGPAPKETPPGAGGSPRLQVFFAADFTDIPYQQGVYKKVAGTWHWPSETPKPGSKAVVIATIRRDGSTSQPALHMKSGSDAWDSAALEAVRQASPFEPLPVSYRPPSVEVHFHFGYEK
jgi:outer membrane biosynthesis protein TonB